MKASRYSITATVARYSEAAPRLHQAGDAAVVERGGVNRQLVLQCPDGCGEVLSINLDPRGGPAWRLYRRRGHWSLFPSVDRPTGCLSHFILWRGRVLWCDGEGEEGEPEIYADLSERVIGALQGDESVGFVELADRLDEVPWDVLGTCRHLVRADILEEDSGEPRGIFIRKNRNTKEPC